MSNLGDGVVKWEFPIRKSKTTRSQELNCLINRFNAWTMRVSSGFYRLCQRKVQYLLTSALMTSWLSKQSMVIAMFLALMRMLLLGHGVMYWEFLIHVGSCNRIRSQTWNYLMNRFNAWTMRVSSGVGKRHFSVVCVCLMGAKFTFFLMVIIYDFPKLTNCTTCTCTRSVTTQHKPNQSIESIIIYLYTYMYT